MSARASRDTWRESGRQGGTYGWARGRRRWHGCSANRERVAIEIERLMAASPPELFGAWTRRFDEWFASPGEIAMDAREEAPFWFDVVFEGEHHAHYGRFLRLVENELLTLTWVTGHGGTEGAETRCASSSLLAPRVHFSGSPTPASTTSRPRSDTRTRGRPSWRTSTSG